MAFILFQASKTRQTFHLIRQIVGSADSINTCVKSRSSIVLRCWWHLATSSEQRPMSTAMSTRRIVTFAFLLSAVFHSIVFSAFWFLPSYNCNQVANIFILRMWACVMPSLLCSYLFSYLKVIEKNIDIFVFSISSLQYFSNSFHVKWDLLFWIAYSLCTITDFQNCLISRIFSVFCSGFLHRTTLYL